jgi:hypothetical protein
LQTSVCSSTVKKKDRKELRFRIIIVELYVHWNYMSTFLLHAQSRNIGNANKLNVFISKKSIEHKEYNQLLIKVGSRGI